MIAPIYRSRGFDSRSGKMILRRKKIFSVDAKRVMSFPQWMRNDLRSLRRSEFRPRRLEQGQVLPAAFHQNLIAEMRDNRKAKDFGVKALGPFEIAHFDSKMIEPFELHFSTIQIH